MTATAHAPRRFAAIDGYRGLFVVLVVAYHLGATVLVGGWVGINHFFVFSGYLITRLLLHEQVRTGSIDVLGFYRRRARRVLPAMFLLVSAVLVHAVLFEEIARRKQQAGDAFATLGFYLNWRLISRDDAYFDMTGSPSPLRHAWTLSVEEQFYVLVPFAVLALCLLSRSRAVRVAVLVVAAVAAAVWTALVGYDGIATLPRVYYGTDTRVQCLLIGAALGFLLGRGDDGRFPRRLPWMTAEVLGWVGLLVSLSAIFLLESTSAWMYNRGGMLVFAVAAALMGASAADPRDLRINRLFSWSPLVFLGRISYGIYLFHWPVVLWLPLDGLPRLVAGPIQFALIVGLAAASYRYIEAPILQHGLRAFVRRRATARSVAIALVAAMFVASGALWRLGTAPSLADGPMLVAGQGDYRPRWDTTKVGVVGDSVGASLVKGFEQKTYPDLALDSFAAIGCDLIDAPAVLDGSAQPADPECTKWRNSWPKTFAEHGNTRLLIVGDTHFLAAHQVGGARVEPGTPAMRQLLLTTLDSIRRTGMGAGARQVSVLNIPCRRIDEKRLDPSLRSFAALGSNDQAVNWTNAVIADWAKQRGVQLLDVHSQLCSTGYTPAKNGVNLYHDTLHFSPQAAAMLWTWLAPTVRDAGR